MIFGLCINTEHQEFVDNRARHLLHSPLAAALIWHFVIPDESSAICSTASIHIWRSVTKQLLICRPRVHIPAMLMRFSRVSYSAAGHISPIIGTDHETRRSGLIEMFWAGLTRFNPRQLLRTWNKVYWTMVLHCNIKPTEKMPLNVFVFIHKILPFFMFQWNSVTLSMSRIVYIAN